MPELDHTEAARQPGVRCHRPPQVLELERSQLISALDELLASAGGAAADVSEQLQFWAAEMHEVRDAVAAEARAARDASPETPREEGAGSPPTHVSFAAPEPEAGNGGAGRESYESLVSPLSRKHSVVSDLI